MSKKEPNMSSPSMFTISSLKPINLPPIPPKPAPDKQGLIPADSPCSCSKKIEELREENGVLKVQMGQLEHRLRALEDQHKEG